MPETHHELLDFEHWANIFPLERFERTEGNRQFGSTKPGDPLDLWKARGSCITGPESLCEIELSRRRAAQSHDLGRRVGSHIFLWKTGEAEKPYLTKVGGVPHRPASRLWPVNADGDPMTFVAQFCFADSKDILPFPVPGDVMLVFMANSEAFFGGQEDIHIEWSDLLIDDPLQGDACPAPRWTVPILTGVLHGTFEYPDSAEVFKSLGHYEYFYFGKTQSTKISTETFYINGDPRMPGQQLLCVFNSILPFDDWSFVNMEKLPNDMGCDAVNDRWGRYEIGFGDEGCMYFFIDSDAKVSWFCDCF